MNAIYGLFWLPNNQSVLLIIQEKRATIPTNLIRFTFQSNNVISYCTKKKFWWANVSLVGYLNLEVETKDRKFYMVHPTTRNIPSKLQQNLIILWIVTAKDFVTDRLFISLMNWRCFVFIVNFKHFYTVFQCFYCWLTGNCWLGGLFR